MGWDGVAWGVGGGALHTPELFRVIGEIAGRGNYGILGLSDCKVAPTGTPSGSVTVDPGIVIADVGNAGYTQQAYVARLATQDTVAIASTGAGSGRVDLVVAQVEDPNLPISPAWSVPVDVTVGPYVFSRVHSNVGAGGTTPAPVTNYATAKAYLAARNLTAEPLALITLPVSTATVLAGHITDLRNVANPKRESRLIPVLPTTTYNLTSATEVDWYTVAMPVFIPTWATRVDMALAAHGVACARSSVSVNGTANGTVRLRLGDATVSGQAPLLTEETAYDVDVPFQAGASRLSIGAAGAAMAIGPGYRGTTQNLRLRGKKTAGNKNIYLDIYSSLVAQLEFTETAA